MEAKAEKARRAAVAVIARVSDALIPEGEVRPFRDRQAVKDFEDLLRRVIQAPVAKEEAQPARGEIIAMRPRKPIDVSRDPYGVFGTTPSAAFNERTRRERTINLREHESLGLAVTPARAHVEARRNVFGGDSPRVAARISREIPRAVCERRPVHELGARIVAVFQRVEDV